MVDQLSRYEPHQGHAERSPQAYHRVDADDGGAFAALNSVDQAGRHMRAALKLALAPAVAQPDGLRSTGNAFRDGPVALGQDSVVSSGRIFVVGPQGRRGRRTNSLLGLGTTLVLYHKRSSITAKRQSKSVPLNSPKVLADREGWAVTRRHTPVASVSIRDKRRLWFEKDSTLFLPNGRVTKQGSGGSKK